MEWSIVAIFAVMLAAWKLWLQHQRAQPETAGPLEERIRKNEDALAAAQKRIANLETIVVDSLEESARGTAIPDEEPHASYVARQMERVTA